MDDNEFYPPVEPNHMDLTDIEVVEDVFLSKYLAAIDYVDGAGLTVTDWVAVKKELKQYLYG